jgi:hypothetical protein
VSGVRIWEKWPTRCESRAKAFSHAVALRWLAPRAIEPALALADGLVILAQCAVRP